jgi:hypothetical protein
MLSNPQSASFRRLCGLFPSPRYLPLSTPCLSFWPRKKGTIYSPTAESEFNPPGGKQWELFCSPSPPRRQEWRCGEGSPRTFHSSPLSLLE